MSVELWGWGAVERLKSDPGERCGPQLRQWVLIQRLATRTPHGRAPTRGATTPRMETRAGGARRACIANPPWIAPAPRGGTQCPVLPVHGAAGGAHKFAPSKPPLSMVASPSTPRL